MRQPKVDPRSNTRRSRFALAVAVAAVVAACAPDAGREPFAAERVYPTAGSDIRFGATTRERFRLDRSLPPAARPVESGALTWTTPPGWSELPATSMRVANFRVAGDEHAECYLTTLTGEGGGLEANVNRWRSQMKQPPLSAADVAALPRWNWFGRPSVWVEIDGTWSGMSGDASGADYRMVGLLLVDPAGSKFLKMIAPKAVAAAETEHFRQLAGSFRDGAAPAAAESSSAASPAAAPADPHAAANTGRKPDDAVHAGMSDGGMSSIAAGASSGPSAFTWTPPAGWTRGPEKAMREVTFLAGEKSEVECYVTALGGDGGGLAANVNRWRQQMGRAELSAAELAGLATIPMMGVPAQWVEIPREGGAQDLMLGAVCLQAEQSVFVKMLGPRASVEAQRAAFLEFCKSIRPGG